MNWFKKKLKESTGFEEEKAIILVIKSLPDLYHQIIRKYGLSSNGDNFYETGKSFTNLKDAGVYLDKYINPLFDNISRYFRNKVHEDINLIDSRIITLDKEIATANSMLDEKIQDGFLYKIGMKITNCQRTEKEMESIIFPEKELQKIIRDITKKSEALINDEVADTERDEGKVLNRAIRQREIFSFARHMLKNFKTTFGMLSDIRHSNFYPPKLIYILIFYTICILLATAEMGFSMTIIQHLLKTALHMDTFFSVVYALGMTLGFSVIFKVLIDSLLHKNWIKTCWFLVITAGLMSVLMVLFSYKGANIDNMTIHINYKGLILGFFSTLFAMANAFLFREASYLHHLKFRLNDNNNIIILKWRRWRYSKKWSEKLASLIEEKLGTEEKKTIYNPKIITDIEKMIENLGQMSKMNFLRGANDQSYHKPDNKE